MREGMREGMGVCKSACVWVCHTIRCSTVFATTVMMRRLYLAIAGDWVDVRDPNVIAETELLQAAASIEAAAKKLAELKPPPKVVC